MTSRIDIEQRFLRLKEHALGKCQKERENEIPLITVGTATCGLAQGALDTLAALREAVQSMDLAVRIKEVGCIGHCYAEPLVTVKMPGTAPYLYGRVTPTKAETLVRYFLKEGDPFLEFVMGALEPDEVMPPVWELPRFYYEKRFILEHCGFLDPESIEDYLAVGGYEGLVRALWMDPEAVIEELAKAQLRGRGGAGFLTAMKWRICKGNSRGDALVICNGDEGDPGAYMDRAILESNPHQVLEGLAIAAIIVGAPLGYIYVRAEYPLAAKRIRKAVEDAASLGLIGPSILGTEKSLEVRVFEGSGAFVCGEETALIASIEGERGMPRPRPPFPAERGLWGRPTLVNNVKTLAAVPKIVTKGAQAFSSVGTESSKGTMVFSVVGKCEEPGLVEVPMGTTLRQLVFEICGGIHGGKDFKGVQIGGPSGGCLPRQLQDTPIDYEALTLAGAMMGSGGIVVMDQDDCMVEVARFFLQFTQSESCGKCTFCRIGTKQLLEILTSITKGEGMLEDLEILEDLALKIKKGSLCNLGATAPNPVITTLRYFKEEYLAHVLEKRCPSLQCPSLIAYYIIPEKCAAGCDACVGTCPTEAVYTMKTRKKAIDQQKCVKCGECVRACPPEYSAVVRISPPEDVPPPQAPPVE